MLSSSGHKLNPVEGTLESRCNVCASSLLFTYYKMMVSSTPLRPTGLLAKWVHAQKKYGYRIMQIFFSELDTSVAS